MGLSDDARAEIKEAVRIINEDNDRLGVKLAEVFKAHGMEPKLDKPEPGPEPGPDDGKSGPEPPPRRDDAEPPAGEPKPKRKGYWGEIYGSDD